MVPREGFPYCEPFFGGDDPFASGRVELFGNARLNPGFGGLQLTEAVQQQSGALVVNQAFPSKGGISISFEYASFGTRNRNNFTGLPFETGADGISVFLFDALVPSFILGADGGSLSYAPRVADNGTIEEPGLSGGYIGIGFDEFGNFANGVVNVGRTREDQNQLNKVLHNVTIRGPQTAKYNPLLRYVTRLENNAIPPFTDIYNDLYRTTEIFDKSVSFTIDNARMDTPVWNASQEGYRKVFIDIIPDGAQYRVVIDMLINTGTGSQLVRITPPNGIPYNFPIPDFLQIGFGGATGGSTNNHVIRNLSVNVFDNRIVQPPNLATLDYELCVGEEMQDTIEPVLEAPSFIQCVQIFENSPGTNPSGNPSGTPENRAPGLAPFCGTNNCDNPVTTLVLPGQGTFTLDLSSTVEIGGATPTADSFDIKFVPVAGFSGVAVAFVVIQDNFGRQSQPIRISVQVLPELAPEDISIDNFFSCGDAASFSIGIPSTVTDGFERPIAVEYVLLAPDGRELDRNDSGDFSISGLTAATAGDYTVEVVFSVTGTDPLKQCISSKTVPIPFNPLPAPDFIPEAALCFGEATGSIEIRGAPNFRYRLNPDTAGEQAATADASGVLVFPNLLAGTYEILAIDPVTDCQELFTGLIVEQPQGPLTANFIEAMDPTCSDNDGSYRFFVEGGTPTGDVAAPYTFELNGTAVPSSAYTLSPSGGGWEVLLFGLDEGTFTLQLIDANACELPLSLPALNRQVLPTFEVNGPFEACVLNPLSLRPSILTEGTPPAAPVYRWFKDPAGTEEILPGTDAAWDMDFGIATDGSLEISNAGTAGSYRVYLMPDIVNDCALAPVAVDFVITPAPEASYTVEAISCAGQTDGIITLSSPQEAGASYTLLGGAGASFDPATGTFSGLAPGTYTVRMTNASGCFVDSEPLLIEDKDPLLLSLSDSVDPSCDLPNGSLSFRISGGTPDASGSYASITLNGQPLSAFSHTLTTAGTEVVLEFMDLPEGSYSLEVQDEARPSDGARCTSTAAATLVAQVLPTFPADADAAICASAPNLLLPIAPLTPGAPVESISYRWFLDAGMSQELNPGDAIGSAGLQVGFPAPDRATLELTNLTDAAGTYVLYVLPVLPSGCTLTPIPYTVTLEALPETRWAAEQQSCAGLNDGRILLIGGGEAGYSYALLGQTTAFDASANAFLGLAPGMYTIEITNAFGCVQQETVEVEAVPPIVLSPLTAVDPSCGDPNGAISFTLEGGNGDFRVQLNGQPLSAFPGASISPASGTDPVTVTVVDLAPGTYAFTVEDANGCAGPTHNVTLVNNQGIPLTTAATQETICEGGDAALRPVITGAGANPLTLTWYADAARTQAVPLTGPDAQGRSYSVAADGTLTVSGLTAGTYTFYAQISGPGVCTIQEEARVEVLPPVVASTVNSTRVTCFGGVDGTISVSGVSGGNGSYLYSIDGVNFQSSPEFSGLPAGTYTVAVKDDSGLTGCGFSTSIEVEGPTQALGATLVRVDEVACGANIGRIEVAFVGGYGPYTAEWRADDPLTGAVLPALAGGTVVEDLPVGTYHLILTDDAGCSVTLPYTISTKPDPVYSWDSSPIEICQGEPFRLRATLTNAGVSPALPGFSWSLQADFSSLITGTQTLSGATFTANGDAEAPQLDIVDLAPGTYTVYGRNDCTGEEFSRAITVEAAPVSSFTVVDESCFGAADGQIRLATGPDTGVRYTVIGPAGSFTLADKAALESTLFPPGTYEVTSISAFACTAKVSLTIEAATELLARNEQVSPTTCGLSDGRIQFEVLGGKAPYQVFFGPDGGTLSPRTLTAAGEITFTDLAVGSYNYRVEDANGCVFTAPAPLQVVDGPTPIIVDDVAICEQEIARVPVAVSPAAAGVSYRWFVGSHADPVAAGATEIADGDVLGGIRYGLEAEGTLMLEDLSLGGSPYTYTVIASGGGICAGDVQTVRVEVLGIPQVSVTEVDERCFGAGGSLRVQEAPGQSLLRYSLNGGAFEPLASGLLDNLAQGTYTLEVVNAANCPLPLGSFTVGGPVEALDFAALGAVNTTCNQTNGLIGGTLRGGTAPYQVQVRTVGGSVVDPSQISWSSATIFRVEGLPVGDFTVDVSDANGCSLPTETLRVSDDPIPVDLNDARFCVGESVALQPSVGAGAWTGGFRWYLDKDRRQAIPRGTLTQGDLTLTVDTADVLTVSGLEVGEELEVFVEMALPTTCNLILAEATISVHEEAELRLRNPLVVCDPTMGYLISDVIENFDPGRYEYQIIAPTGDELGGPQERVFQSGTYAIASRFIGSPCFNSPQEVQLLIEPEAIQANFSFEVEDPDTGELLPNHIIGVGELLRFTDLTTGDPGAVWQQWDFGDGEISVDQNPSHSFSSPGTYTITLFAETANQCRSQMQAVVRVIDGYLWEAPTAIYPGGPRLENEVFKPQHRGIVAMELHIFNLWGEQLFKTEILDSSWDATFKGQPVPGGNYAYRAIVTSRGGTVSTEAGYFKVIR